MNNNYMHLFTDAAREVFKEMGFSDVTFLDFHGDGFPTQIMANVGITGDLQGYMILYSDLESAKRFVARILDNMDMNQETGFSQFHKETIGEIVNQVSGRSTMLLAKLNIDCNVTPPTIFTGQQITYDIRNLDEILWHKVSGSFGSIILFIGIKKTVKAI